MNCYNPFDQHLFHIIFPSFRPHIIIIINISIIVFNIQPKSRKFKKNILLYLAHIKNLWYICNEFEQQITMTVNEIKKLFENNQMTEGFSELSDVIDIANHVNVKTLIDEDEMNYYCVIDVAELANSTIDNDTIFEMVTNGWTLSKNKKNLIKFC